MPFIHPDATVVGNVVLGERVSVWPGAVLRGDCAAIIVGDESNIQDGVVLHVDYDAPCTIGKRVTVGHRAIIHGATIEDECLIGMGAIVLNHVVIGRGSLVGAGAVVPEGTRVPAGSVVLGVPARVVRPVDDTIRARIAWGAQSYLNLQARHERGEFPNL